jgi:hypothetical protein
MSFMTVQTPPVASLSTDFDAATEVADVLARTIDTPGRILVVSDGSDSFVEALSAKGWSIHQQAPLGAGSAGVITFDADAWLSEWSSAPWDAVVVVGVLEFAADPLAILRALRSVLAANGWLAVVVPNVVHGSVRLAVLDGGFPFQDWEHLDNVPIRFFTHEGLLSLLRSADLALSDLVRNTHRLDVSGDHAPDNVLDSLSGDSDALTSHFIALARPLAPDDSAVASLSDPRNASMNLSVKGWSGPGDPIEAARYRRTIHRIRGVVRATVPSDASVLVVSRGDEALLALDGRPAWHFPMIPDGRYAGHHPANSAEAIALLEVLRDRGARFLVIPSTALWWLEYYDEFARHLERQYATTLRREDTCVVFNLEARQ